MHGFLRPLLWMPLTCVLMLLSPTAYAQPAAGDAAWAHADRLLYTDPYSGDMAPLLRDSLADAVWTIAQHEWRWGRWQRDAAIGLARDDAGFGLAARLHSVATVGVDRTSTRWLKQRAALGYVSFDWEAERVVEGEEARLQDDPQLGWVLFAVEWASNTSAGFILLDEGFFATRSLEAAARWVPAGEVPTPGDRMDLLVATGLASQKGIGVGEEYAVLAACYRVAFKRLVRRGDELSAADRRDVLEMYKRAATMGAMNFGGPALQESLRYSLHQMEPGSWREPAGTTPADVWLLMHWAAAGAQEVARLSPEEVLQRWELVHSLVVSDRQRWLVHRKQVQSLCGSAHAGLRAEGRSLALTLATAAEVGTFEAAYAWWRYADWLDRHAGLASSWDLHRADESEGDPAEVAGRLAAWESARDAMLATKRLNHEYRYAIYVGWGRAAIVAGADRDAVAAYRGAARMSAACLDQGGAHRGWADTLAEAEWRWRRAWVSTYLGLRRGDGP